MRRNAGICWASGATAGGRPERTPRTGGRRWRDSLSQQIHIPGKKPFAHAGLAPNGACGYWRDGGRNAGDSSGQGAPRAKPHVNCRPYIDLSDRSG